MAEQEAEQEYQEVKARRGGGFFNLFKNINNLQFIAIIILVIIFVYMLDAKASKIQLFIIGFSILAILLYSQKAGKTSLISEEVAKKIAVECLEAKKEEYHLPSDADITPTNFCVLQYRMAEAFKWHIGIKVEDKFGKIDYWRVIIHPFDGVVIGIVDEPLGFSEKSVRDVVVVFPDYMTQE